MIRFEVTGETAQEFAENALNAWGLLAIGLQEAVQRMAAQQPSAPEPIPPTVAQPTSGSESSSTASKGAPIVATTTNPATVHSDPVQDLFVENPNPSTASSPISPMEKSPKGHGKSKGPKLDDLKTRLSEVIVAATERWDQKRANAYARKLLYAVGVEKLSALDPKCYDDFMQHSEIYLDGTHPE